MLRRNILLLLALFYKVFYQTKATENQKFPDGFLIGAASASYQVEGAWNEDGKGDSIWDYLLHTNKSVLNGENGDVACDSYHKYKEDVKVAKEMGLSHYRFSIAWPRILPKGYDCEISQKGIAYYHNLIDELLVNGIEPLVTLYHWDLPQKLQEIGGWANPLIVDYFTKYAEIVFKEYADKVKYWSTFNEPLQITQGYGDGKFAPKIYQHGVADYIVAKNILKSHAAAYHLYDKNYRKEGGKIGIVFASYWFFPKANTTEDKAAADRSLAFQVGIFSHPIFSETGDWPAVVKERVAKNSKEEGWSTSRLPEFTKEEIECIKGTSDYFGLNYYTARYSTSGTEGEVPSWSYDSGSVLSSDSAWKTSFSSWIKVVPWGLRAILNWLKEEYNNPSVFICENGVTTDDTLEDTDKIEYLYAHMKEMLKAIYEDSCNVMGYTVWSLTDNLSWQGGYEKRFGLVHIDYKDSNLPRTLKKSGYLFKTIMETKELPCSI